MGQKNLFKDIMGNKGIGKQGCIAGSMGYPGLPQGQRERVRQIGAGGRWGWWWCRMAKCAKSL